MGIVLILEDLTAEIPDTNSYHWNLKQYSSDDQRNVLMYGYNSSANTEFHKLADGYRKIYFNNWSPCEFAQAMDHNGLTPLNYDDKFDIIYSICPFSVDWLNDIQQAKKYRYVFYPFEKSLIPEPKDKKYDVIYHGGIHGKEHISALQVMKKYNYRYCTMTHGINNLTRHFLPMATNTNLAFRDKINLVAQSKISICYNIVHVMPEQVSRILDRPRHLENKAFATVNNGWDVMPQFKTRIHEAAISKTLNLVRRDNWNVIEDFYEPDREFIYFDDETDLSKKIDHILSNWDDYQVVIENAFNKSLNYTTEKFISKIQEDMDNDL